MITTRYIDVYVKASQICDIYDKASKTGGTPTPAEVDKCTAIIYRDNPDMLGNLGQSSYETCHADFVVKFDEGDIIRWSIYCQDDNGGRNPKDTNYTVKLLSVNQKKGSENIFSNPQKLKPVSPANHLTGNVGYSTKTDKVGDETYNIKFKVTKPDNGGHHVFCIDPKLAIKS